MIDIGHADLDEVDDFMALWAEMLQSLEKNGSDVAVTNRTLLFYRDLLVRCIGKEAPGVALVAYDGVLPVGVLLWCDPATEARDETRETVFGYGAYTSPPHRKRGVSRMLRERAILDLDKLGTEEVVGSAILRNKGGMESSRAVGFVPTQVIGVLDVPAHAESIRSGEPIPRYQPEGECPFCGHNNEGEAQ